MGTRGDGSRPRLSEGRALLDTRPPAESFYTSSGLVRALWIGNALGAIAHGTGIGLTIGLTWCQSIELPMYTIQTNATTPLDPPRLLGDGITPSRFKPVLVECCSLYPVAMVIGFFGLSFAFHVFFTLVLLCHVPHDSEGKRRDGVVTRIGDWYLRCLSECRAPWCAPALANAAGPALFYPARVAGAGSNIPSRRPFSSRSVCASWARARLSCSGR